MNCPLYLRATQTVFGEGPASARVMFVGEQPGDREDREGHPFVGPAGGILSKALERAGIARADVYVTNAVKHFKWEPRGKRRMHKTPAQREIEACSPWLESELRIVQPEVLVCLGATAAKALLGKNFRVTIDRGKFVDSTLASRVLATAHPSSILRAGPQREEAFEALVRDLRVVAQFLAQGSARRSHARPPEEQDHGEGRIEHEAEANERRHRAVRRERNGNRRVGAQ